MDCSMPGLPVHHQLPEFTQTRVRWVSDAIQPSHPLSSPSPPAFNLSQQQGLLQWVSSLHQVAKVLEFQLQHQPFQWIFRTDFIPDWFHLGLTGWISLQSKGLYHMWNRSPVQVQCIRQGAQGWCTGMTLRDWMGREVGREFRMGNTCTPMADSCQCMAKQLKYCKVISLKLK